MFNSSVDEVFAAGSEQVASVGALWGSGETEKKLGLEVVDEAPVGAGGVVELVNNNVVEGVRAEVSEARRLAESLDRGEEHVGGGVFVGAGVEAECGVGADAAEGVEGLAQDLLAVGDEEDALRAEAPRVECGEPGLTDSGGEHDEATGVAFGAGLLEGFEGLLLDVVGLGDLTGRLGRYADGELALFRALAAIALDPLRVEGDGLRMVEEALEFLDHLVESVGLGGG